MSPHAFLAPVLLAAFLVPTAAAQSICQPQWLPTFGAQSSLSHHADALVTYDDGSGSALYAGGRFTIAGSALAERIAKWDGRRWSALGSGLGGAYETEVFALAVFDDSNGPALYAGGRFTNAGGVAASNIARWDGTQWSALGSGLGSAARTLAVFDDGSGPALFVGGDFFTAGGVPARHFAKWDGSTWSEVGGGVFGGVYALGTFDDGTGRALFVGGGFAQVGGTQVSNIARWDGSAWSALGVGVGPGGVDVLTTYDDGSGLALYAGGYFVTAGGTPANYLAKWDGSAWSRLGAGLDHPVYALTVHDEGTGAQLIAGGSLQFAGGVPVQAVARWDGAHWSAIGTNLGGTASALAVYDAGSGPELFAGGELSAQSDPAGGNIARWNGTTWQAPSNQSLGSGVLCGISYDDGSGPRLYVGGAFTSVFGMPASRIAAWDGQAWSALGNGLDPGNPNSRPYSMAVYDDGGGPSLYVCGSFTLAGGVVTNGIARWRNGAWSALGTGLHNGSQPGQGLALAVHDDGSGPALYVGGSFTQAGSVAAHHIARWNGSSWSALGSGTDTAVYALTTHDEGSGTALYVGGNFYSAGGLSVDNIARWNGSSWSAVGNPVVGMGLVDCMASFDDGSGPALYVGGNFHTQNGSMGNGIAKWDGAQWSNPGGGLTGGSSLGGANALTVFDDGSGPALFVGGGFTAAGGVPASCLAKWDGNAWSALGSGTYYTVSALAQFDDTAGHGLYAGGYFVSCYDSGDSYLARWVVPAGCMGPGLSICEPGSLGVGACPCANPPNGAGRGCDNSSATGGAQLSASGVARVSNDTLVLVTSGEMPSATSVVLQGDALNTAGAVFGQGVRCVAGSLKRMYVKTAIGGSITAPGAGDATISQRSAALGDPIAPGTRRYYGVYYRDPNVLGGCPATSTFNITQQLDVLWYP